METSVRVDDPEGAVDWSDPAEESSHHSGFDWVYYKVTGFTFLNQDTLSISAFVNNHNVLIPDTDDGILAINYFYPTDTICIGRSSSETHFFFIYSCLFSDLHVALPFDDFTMGVLRALNVAPSQLHPNT